MALNTYVDPHIIEAFYIYHILVMKNDMGAEGIDL
jgi:hypothetical protein